MSHTARVIIASTRAAAGVYTDRCGPIVRDWLCERGFDVPAPVVVADNDPVRTPCELPWPTGPTSSSPPVEPAYRRRTARRKPPGRARLSDSRLGRRDPPVRGCPGPHHGAVAGRVRVAGGSLVVNLPGSTGGVRDGLAVLAEVIDHALEQLSGETTDDPHRRASVTEQAILLAEHEHLVANAAAGAVVGFAGIVRNHDGGREFSTWSIPRTRMPNRSCSGPRRDRGRRTRRAGDRRESPHRAA